MITSKTMYVTRNQAFPTFEKAIEYREGLVEEFIRNLPGFQDIPAKKRIEFISVLLNNKEALRDLLDYPTELPDINSNEES